MTALLPCGNFFLYVYYETIGIFQEKLYWGFVYTALTHSPPLKIVSPLHSADADLLQSEQEALLALSKLLHIWYSEAGLHGMLRSLDATVAQCHAIREEFAAESADTRLDAERGAISQHLRFMLSLCAD